MRMFKITKNEYYRQCKCLTSNKNQFIQITRQ